MINFKNIYLDYCHYLEQASFISINFFLVLAISLYMPQESASLIIAVLSIYALIITISSNIISIPFFLLTKKNNINETSLLIISCLEILVISFTICVASNLFFQDLFNGNFLNVTFFICSYSLWDFIRRAMYKYQKVLTLSIISLLLSVVSLLFLLTSFFNEIVNPIILYNFYSALFITVCFIIGFNFFAKENFFIPKRNFFYRVLQKQIDYSKSSLPTSIILWLSSSGLFLILLETIDNDVLIANRVFLAVSALIGFWTVGYENKTLPEIRKNFLDQNLTEIKNHINTFNKDFLLFCGTLSIISFSYFFLMKNVYGYLYISVLFIFYQIIYNYTKIYALLLIAQWRQFEILKINIMSISVAGLVTYFCLAYFSDIAIIICSLTFSLFQFIGLYSLNRNFLYEMNSKII